MLLDFYMNTMAPDQLRKGLKKIEVWTFRSHNMYTDNMNIRILSKLFHVELSFRQPVRVR